MSYKRVGLLFVVVSAGGVLACTVLGFAGAWWWPLDLLAHFRVQYVVLAGMFGAAALGLRLWRVAAGAGVALVINAVAVAPLWLGSAAAPAAGVEPLRVVLFNVNFANARHADIVDNLAAADADVIAVLEVSGELEVALRERFAGYDMVVEPRSHSFGIALLARGQVEYVDAFAIDELSDILSAHAVVTKGGHRYAVLALHTMPPVGSAHAALRDRMMAGAARWARAQTATPVIAGDFNATPWSHAFRALLDDGDLVSSQPGHGFQATWGPWPLRIPIDHVVHGRAVTTVSRTVGPSLGSDHHALHVEIAPAR